MSSVDYFTNAPVLRDYTAARANDPVDPATSCLIGSITYDRRGNDFNLEWDSMEAFKDWLDKEQTAQSIELKISKITHGRGNALYTTNQTFRCTRNGTGGSKCYQKKTTRERRAESKRLAGGCPCLVQIKTYPHTDTVLGKYVSNHSHPIGMENLKFIWMRDSTREMIVSMIRHGMNDTDIKEEIRDLFSEQERDHYVTIAEISRIRKSVESGSIRFDPDDAKSTRIWAEKTCASANNIIRLAQEIITIAPADPQTARSLRMIESQLNALLLSVKENGSQLPEKEQIIPANQPSSSWPFTADCMLTVGVPKRKRPADDLYGAAEESQKRAKPDAVSAATNA